MNPYKQLFNISPNFHTFVYNASSDTNSNTNTNADVNERTSTSTSTSPDSRIANYSSLTTSTAATNAHDYTNRNLSGSLQNDENDINSRTNSHAPSSHSHHEPQHMIHVHSYPDIANLGTYLPVTHPPHTQLHPHPHSHSHSHAPDNSQHHSHSHAHSDLDVDLLTLVQSYEWSATLSRISTHPSEATSVGEQGRTPLHVACDHDAPASVIRALLRANPGAAVMVGTSDMNPLHITCSSQHASVEVVRVLLDGTLLGSCRCSVGSMKGHGNSHGDDDRGNCKSHDTDSHIHIDALKVTAMKDVDGDTCLHAACRCGAPIEVLEVLLRANPALVKDRDYEGLTPLLRLWVRYFVTLGDDMINGVSCREDVTGELAVAWSKTELLLRAAYYGSIDLQSNNDEGEVQDKDEKKKDDANSIGTNENDGGDRGKKEGGKIKNCSHEEESNEEAKAAVETESSLAKAAKSFAHKAVDDDKVDEGTTGTADARNEETTDHIDQIEHQRRPFHALHAASTFDCPRAVVKIATVLYPEQLEQYDSSLRTPLMIAAMAPIFKEHDLSDEGYSIEELIHGDPDDDDVNTPQHTHDDYTEQKQPTVIQVLLEAGANASNNDKRFKQGRLPFHAAIISGKRWHEGLKILQQSYPDALVRLDAKTGLYPFMLAAAVGIGELKEEITTKGRQEDLNTIFEILRSRPDQCATCCTTCFPVTNKNSH